MTANELDILASDQERLDAEERLRAAVESGRLPVDRLAERLDEVHAARTRGELETACRGLPAAGPATPSSWTARPPAAPSSPASSAASNAPARGSCRPA
ncbi:DUF1707 domain-containing protein [Streptomyces sp. SBR177]